MIKKTGKTILLRRFKNHNRVMVFDVFTREGVEFVNWCGGEFQRVSKTEFKQIGKDQYLYT